jgi:hypothetical protein
VFSLRSDLTVDSLTTMVIDDVTQANELSRVLKTHLYLSTLTIKSTDLISHYK